MGRPRVLAAKRLILRWRKFPSIMYDRRPMSTATDRAAEAVEAAERIYADEMGATLDLSPAAKMTLIATITAAIQAAVAEETQKLTWVL